MGIKKVVYGSVGVFHSNDLYIVTAVMMDDMWDQGLNDDSSKLRFKWWWWFQKIFEQVIDHGKSITCCISKDTICIIFVNYWVHHYMYIIKFIFRYIIYGVNSQILPLSNSFFWGGISNYPLLSFKSVYKVAFKKESWHNSLLSADA